jgi:hypothetical protein
MLDEAHPKQVLHVRQISASVAIQKGRVVPDLPDFCRELVAALAKG